MKRRQHHSSTLTTTGVECAHVLSVDGVGAFDLTPRASMLEGLWGIEGGDTVLVSQFYSSASTYIWEDDLGVTHEIIQGEGGEQGLMPALFAVGQQIVCSLTNTSWLSLTTSSTFTPSSRIQIHQWKTEVWNQCQVELANSTCCMQFAARESHHCRTGSRDLGHLIGTC